MSPSLPPSPSVRAAFEAGLPFELDGFQLQAMDALDAGRSVVVAAPTGSGKTIVAEYAVARALAAGGRAFYTTPIKALSNQKFVDLCALHGSDRVGLLTGDTSINDTAPVVVMTTEVLRNMIYARSRSLDGLRYVVLDEVHFLQDTYRGPVWEEVIIHTPLDVDLVCLSATVSNAAELADWVTTVRGATDVIVHHDRPVELDQLHLVADRGTGRIEVLDMFVGGRPNPAALRLDAEAAERGPRRRRELATPRRGEVVELLRMEEMLPAIWFIFSRAACDEAMRGALHAGVRLTTAEERAAIRDIIEPRMAQLTDADLDVLDFDLFLAGLENGIAAHHAGMVPPFKEAVEACFVEGLVKVVFATETLALGINMPARTVVIEKLSKYAGSGHAMLTPGEYTQLTGRAGRRGIDHHGFAVTLWSPFMPFQSVAELASQRTYELRSAFRPTYNMAANLVRRSSREQAHHLLRLSFAQFQLDAHLVRANARIDRVKRELAEARAAARCERGDVDELRRSQQIGPWRGAPAGESEVRAVFERVRPGDVLRCTMRGGPAVRGAPDDPVVVVGTAGRKGDHLSIRVLTITGRLLSITPSDLRDVPTVVGDVRLPTPFNPQSKAFRRELVGSLGRLVSRERRTGGRSRPGREHRGDEALARDLDPAAVSAAPVPDGVEGCPDLDEHLRAAARADRLQRELERAQQSAAERASSLVDQLDRVLGLLQGAGFVDGWALTPGGEQLCAIFHESDLLIADCIRAGLLDGLTSPQLAALASVFVYERRGAGRGPRHPGGHDRSAPADLPVRFPRALMERWFAIVERAEAINDRESAAGLPLTRLPDPGFASLAQAWAAGKDLDRILGHEDITGGDFVRTVKALTDLLRQVAMAAPDPATRAAASTAAQRLFRGVVAASSTPTVSTEEADAALHPDAHPHPHALPPVDGGAGSDGAPDPIVT